MIQPVTEIPEGNRIELSLNGGILMKGQPTEVLAGSGEPAEDAENPESGKPPILSLKIQGEGRVVQGESWSPGRQEGCWARSYNLGSGEAAPEILQGHCFTPPRLRHRKRWKKQLLSSLSLIPYLCVPSAGQTRSQLEGVSF